MITAVSNCPSCLTDHRCFVHLISVEYISEYNIELVDLVDFRYLNSTQLSDDRLDRFRGLSDAQQDALHYMATAGVKGLR